MDKEIVVVRRQHNGRVGETHFKNLHGLQWDQISGGIKLHQQVIKNARLFEKLEETSFFADIH